jgi:hypothetical protein
MNAPSDFDWIYRGKREVKNEHVEMWLDGLMQTTPEGGKPRFAWTIEGLREIGKIVFPKKSEYVF